MKEPLYHVLNSILFFTNSKHSPIAPREELPLTTWGKDFPSIMEAVNFLTHEVKTEIFRIGKSFGKYPS